MTQPQHWCRARAASSARRGTTLVELLVVLAILAVLAGVAVPALPRVRGSRDEGGFESRVESLRRRAATSGRTVVDTVRSDGRAHAVTAHPDGRVVTEPPSRQGAEAPVPATS